MFSCTKARCMTHMWICLTNKKDNMQKLEKFKTDLQKKGFHLGLTTVNQSQPLRADQQALSSAIRKMKRTEKDKSKEIVPVPEGEPLFLFHGAKGRNRSLNTFYDSGCSHAVFKSGIPGTELKGQVVAKGPFNIGGVGGMACVLVQSLWTTGD